MINSAFKPWIYWYASPGIREGAEGIKGGQISFLNKSQIKEIDEAAKEILNKTGVKIPNKVILDRLKELGSKVVYKEERVCISPSLVNEALNKTPKTFKFAGRDSKNYITLDTEQVYFVHGIGPYLVAPDGSMKQPTLRDMQDTFRIVSACENVDVAGIPVGGTHSTPVEYMDLPVSVRRLKKYAMMLDIMEKPVDTTKQFIVDSEDETGSATQGSLDQIKMEVAVRGSLDELRKFPMSLGFNEAVSPLMFLPRNLEKLIVYAQHGLPMFIGSGPMINATGPATLAGTITLWLAETLAGLVIGYAMGTPGNHSPALWMCFTGTFDQRSAHGPIMGSPEGAMVQAACGEIAHYYGFPLRGCIGSPSKTLDPQTGYDTAVSLMVSAIAGVNYNVSIGTVGPGEVGVSKEKIVLDNDLVGYIKRVMNGIEVTEETIAVDVIDKVGIGGSYLMNAHTRKWFRKEQYFPSLFDRNKHEVWIRRGQKDAVMRAQERIEEILRDYWPEPLDADIRKRIENHVKVVAKRERKRSNQ